MDKRRITRTGTGTTARRRQTGKRMETSDLEREDEGRESLKVDKKRELERVSVDSERDRGLRRDRDTEGSKRG